MPSCHATKCWPHESCSSSAAGCPPAAADGDDTVMRLQHVPIARDLQALVAVRHNQRSLRPEQEQKRATSMVGCAYMN